MRAPVFIVKLLKCTGSSSYHDGCVVIHNCCSFVTRRKLTSYDKNSLKYLNLFVFLNIFVVLEILILNTKINARKEHNDVRFSEYWLCWPTHISRNYFLHHILSALFIPSHVTLCDHLADLSVVRTIRYIYFPINNYAFKNSVTSKCTSDWLYDHMLHVSKVRFIIKSVISLIHWHHRQNLSLFYNVNTT